MTNIPLAFLCFISCSLFPASVNVINATIVSIFWHLLKLPSNVVTFVNSPNSVNSFASVSKIEYPSTPNLGNVVAANTLAYVT